MDLSLSEFNQRVREKLKSEAIFTNEEVYEGVHKVYLKIDNHEWFGIGNSLRDAKISVVDKACKFFRW